MDVALVAAPPNLNVSEEPGGTTTVETGATDSSEVERRRKNRVIFWADFFLHINVLNYVYILREFDDFGPKLLTRNV